MKHRGVIIFTVLGLHAFFISSCAKARGEMTAYSTVKGKDSRSQVRTCFAKEITIPDEVNGFGSLSFLKKVDITSPQEGKIVTMLRQEGTPVSQGTVVAVLENPQINLGVNRAKNARDQALAAWELARARLLEGKFQAEARILDLAKTEAELAQARKEYQEQARKLEDQEALYKAGGITEETIRSARFALESMAERLRLQEQDLAIRWIGLRTQDLRAAGIDIPKNEAELLAARIRLATTTLQAEVQAAEAQLGAASRELESAMLAEQELTLTSPLSGILAARYVEPGERVKRDDKLLTIIDTRSLYAVIPVREQDAQRIAGGMEAQVVIDGLPNPVPARVELVSPTADNQSFTFMVRLLLDSRAVQKGKLKPGMFARATIHLGNDRKALVIPESALVEKQADTGRVFIIQQNRLLEKTIRLGQTIGTNREVLDGLTNQMVLVDKPETGLQEGDYVEILQ
ncbi:efflux RND transporter periplasmic adaptor subunit [Gracilinema caldarium]|uniref:Efflux transporter, RND family, MFP subunit n=1 Tax=Gracilinema caldarium (strain ATCC 51460 / DSM 7334 / H1) TaxID=744872 RepID=F8EXI3_GRAC1|nr:efflux RND transporter periplasmic adaptor subunit [Gracilinema caldarium]AEJ19210.1 efflux transporter, RND family, MFP subunit [Gracilinema caldarium DSM 7334]